MTNRPDIKQLKLTSGEEIICEILDDNDLGVAVRNCLSLSKRVTPDGTTYHTFGSYMIFQDRPERVILIVPDKIMSIAIPSQEMMHVYNEALAEVETSYDDESSADLDDSDQVATTPTYH